jgi:hypothetical protein
MTEADWLACTSPEDLLYYATYGTDPPPADATALRLDVGCPAGHVPPTPRQLALAVLGWAERAGGAAHDQATAQAVRLLAAGADGAVGPEAVPEFRARHPETVSPGYEGIGVWVPFILWGTEDGPLPVEAAEAIAELLSPLVPPADQCAVLRDVLGNPFRRATADPGWLTPTVVQVASGIYAERAFDRLPILADALQEAGCEDEQVLGHCRGPGPHVRGCWVVDLLLGNE